MPMYVERPALGDARDLYQGDILLGMLRIHAPGEKNFGLLQREGKTARFDYRTKPHHLKSPGEALRVFSKVEPVDVLVLSPTCDNARGAFPIMLAPLADFQFKSDNVDKMWLQLSQAATGTATPKRFYLPAHPSGRLKRSWAQLPIMFMVQPSFVDRCIKQADTERLCGITDEAQVHLRWQLGLYFGRNAREDQDWPSTDDLGLKLRALEERVGPAEPTEETQALHDEIAQLRDLLSD